MRASAFWSGALHHSCKVSVYWRSHGWLASGRLPWTVSRVALARGRPRHRERVARLLAQSMDCVVVRRRPGDGTAFPVVLRPRRAKGFVDRARRLRSMRPPRGCRSRSGRPAWPTAGASTTVCRSVLDLFVRSDQPDARITFRALGRWTNAGAGCRATGGGTDDARSQAAALALCAILLNIAAVGVARASSAPPSVGSFDLNRGRPGSKRGTEWHNVASSGKVSKTEQSI